MKSEYRVVVIGGGVVGASVLYHLARAGWSDICLFERRTLAAGSSWHAAGGVHTLNADPDMAALQAYTIELLTEIERESGQSIGFHENGGVTIATTQERWEWIQSTYRIFQTIGIEDCRLLTPADVGEACPIMNVSDVLGGLWAGREGYVDTTGTVLAYAGAAKRRGATVIEGNRVLSLEPAANGGWRVITEQGDIAARHVVNAAGLWAKQVGRMVGLELPLAPLEHHYLITEAMPDVAALGRPLPMSVDPDGFTYMRQDQNGILVGIYETNHKHWHVDGAPWEYGVELIAEDTDRIEDELVMACHRYPALADVGIKTWVNGAFTFSPDGNPLVGPVRGLPNYWLACGVMAGFLQGGGVGKSLAEWMIDGETKGNSFPLDIARYGAFASNMRYIRETTGQFYSRRFVMAYPNEQLPAGRPVKTSPVHDDLTRRGACWGVDWGLETPLYFAPTDFVERPTLRRSNAFDIVAAECRASRSKAGLLDISGYSRFRVSGRGARAWLDRLLAGRVPAPHRCRLTPMLSPTGRLRGDLVCIAWGDDYWLMGSYHMREWHLRWFENQCDEATRIEDISDSMVGYAVIGPRARDLLQPLTNADLSDAGFPFMDARSIDVGLIRVRAARISVTGELGFELNCPASEHRELYHALTEAGRDVGAVDIGFNALKSLRVEKSFGAWGSEFMQSRTADQTGLGRWIDLSKDGFVGRDAVIAERRIGAPDHCLATLQIDASDADASLYEPIWKDDRRVGFVTSGAYGHCVDMSLAMAMLDRECAAVGTELSCHVVGERRAARVIAPSPHDPSGERLRS